MTIYDISLSISESAIVWPGDPAIRMTRRLNMDHGDVCNLTCLELSAHSGTHLDAPGHFLSGGTGVDTLDLNVLVGPVLVVEAHGVDHITADLFQTLNIGPDTERVLVRTKNSDRWAAGETKFFTQYVALTPDAAKWLVDHNIKLIGVDYLGVAPFDDPVPTHQALFEAGVIVVEGLNLSRIASGNYHLVCLPLKIEGCDGAPARAILID